MAVKITQLGGSATPRRRFGSFAGRSPSGTGHPVSIVTQHGPAATPGRRYGSFTGRATSSSGGAFYIFGETVVR